MSNYVSTEAKGRLFAEIILDQMQNSVHENSVTVAVDTILGGIPSFSWRELFLLLLELEHSSGIDFVIRAGGKPLCMSSNAYTEYKQIVESAHNSLIADQDMLELNSTALQRMDEIELQIDKPVLQKMLGKDESPSLNAWSGDQELAYDRAHRSLKIGDNTITIPMNDSPNRALLLDLLVQDFNQDEPTGVSKNQFMHEMESEEMVCTMRSFSNAVSGLRTEISSALQITDFVKHIQRGLYQIPKN